MDKQAKEYKGRGLHNPKFKGSFTNGSLKDLLTIVKEDDDLVLQIRNNYVNIYYKGGNLSKIESENIYTVIDLEFQISTISEYKYESPEGPKDRRRNDEKKSPRFDIIAVRNNDKQLCVIELKCGTGALDGKSGLGDHADSFEGTIKRNPAPFVKEIKNIIRDKIDLGLLSKNFSINEKEPEFMFAFVTKEGDKDRNGFVRNEEEQIQFLNDEIVRQKCSDYKVLLLKDDGNFRLE